MRILTLALVLGMAGFAFAQESVEEAEKAMQVGGSLYRQKKFAEAIEAFRKASQLVPEASGPHREMAKCYRRLKKFDEAIHHFTQYLELRPDAPERDEIEELIQTLREDKLPTENRIPISIDSEPQGAVVYVLDSNGEAQGIGLTPLEAHPIKSSVVAIRVISPGYLPVEEKITPQADSPISLLLTLKTSSPESLLPEPQPPDTLPSPRKGVGLLKVGALAGAGSAALGAIFFIDRASFLNLPAGDPTAQGRQRRLLVEAVAADALLVAALTTGGLGLLRSAKAKKEAPSATPPKEEEPGLTLRLMPSLTGLTLSGSF